MASVMPFPLSSAHSAGYSPQGHRKCGYPAAVCRRSCRGNQQRSTPPCPGSQTAPTKTPRKGDVLLHGNLALQGNLEAACKLGFLSALGFFHSVPEKFTVCVLWRSMGRQQDFRTDRIALVGVAAVLAVILAVQLFPGATGRSSHGSLSGAALDPGHVKMIRSDRQSPPNSFLLCGLTASMRGP